jgi:hypothetical protein
MKINWHTNPLKTTIDLDNRDRYQILLYIQNEEYESLLCVLDLWLKGTIKKDQEISVEKIHEKLREWKEICDMQIDHEDVKAYEEYLQMTHAGDCTCFPSSCGKCLAEEALGIDTIEGLRKHAANKIYGAFSETDDINEAISYLEKQPSYIKPDTWPDEVGYEVHLTRWESERKSALKWLKQYKETHGF